MKKFTKFFILAGVLFNFSILNAEIREVESKIKWKSRKKNKKKSNKRSKRN